jgi:hypothetical protein
MSLSVFPPLIMTMNSTIGTFPLRIFFCQPGHIELDGVSKTSHRPAPALGRGSSHQLVHFTEIESDIQLHPVT